MQTIKEIIEIVSKLFGISAAIVAVLTGAFGVYTYFRDSKRKLCSDTIAEYKRMQEDVFKKLNELTPNDVRVLTETADSTAYYELQDCLAKIEHFCVGINRGVYDFETVYQLSHGYFDYKLQRLFEPLLDQKLNKYDGGEDYYNNLHKVWARMKARSDKEL